MIGREHHIGKGGGGGGEGVVVYRAAATTEGIARRSIAMFRLCG